MLEAIAMQHAVVAERELPEFGGVVAESVDFVGRRSDTVALAGGQIMKFSAEGVNVSCSELASDIILDKCPIGPQRFETIDVTETGKFTVTTKNFGHNPDGTYTNPDEPASSWINGVFQGHGITRDKVLATAIATKALPEGSTEEVVAKASNDLYVSMVMPDGSLKVMGELIGVELFSGVEVTKEFDAMAFAKSLGYNLTREQLAHLKIMTQEKGAGGYSLGVVITAPKKAPTPPTSLPTPSTTVTLPPKTTVPAPTTTVTLPSVPTTTMVSTTTTSLPATTVPSTTVKANVPTPVVTEIANTGNRPLNGQIVGGLSMMALGAGATAFTQKRRKQPRSSSHKN